MDKQVKDRYIKFALEKGYTEVLGHGYSHGEKIFKHKKKRKYISIDNDRHSGGIWKMATSIVKLKDNKTRDGTFDKHLEWYAK